MSGDGDQRRPNKPLKEPLIEALNAWRTSSISYEKVGDQIAMSAQGRKLMIAICEWLLAYKTMVR